MSVRARERFLIAAVIVLALLLGLDSISWAEEEMSETDSYLEIPFKTIDGQETSLEQFEGKVVLIVNTASKCGFTPQYEGLEDLYEKYADRGFTILGFPANDFLNQEPGDNAQIKQFCTMEYGVTFPMMSKISVKGKDQHPLYTYLTEESPFPGKITWNFNKFLLDRNGKVIARFDTRVTPEDEKLVAAVESAL